MSKKGRQLADRERLRVIRQKELNNLTAAMQEREEAHEPAQKMITDIQEREIQYQIEKGGILQGRWNQLLYHNVKDDRALEHLEKDPTFLRSADMLPAPAVPAFKEDVVYDGFNTQKQFKYQQYNRLIEM